MSYISLIDQLTKEDKEKIEKYIGKYGNAANPVLSADEWLTYWDHSKQKLYKALGNSLIREFPYKFAKSEEILRNEIIDLKCDLSNWYEDLIECYFFKTNEIDDDYSIRSPFYQIMGIRNLTNNAIEEGIRKITLANGKILQIPKGTKIAKAINKIFEATKATQEKTPEFEEFCKNFTKHFDTFKKQHSIVLNEKEIKSTLCFSIHPLDFITMSDNSLRWESCMNWREPGCYRAGTIEMMNSNNVICAYLKSSSPFEFAKGYAWNNKKWRQLFYITKDIIVCGKSYPFTLEKTSQIDILTKLKDVVCENTNWSYNFGPELYRDMIHIHSKYRMDVNRDWITYNQTTKHNILFDTQMMYNDFLNDIHFNYYCFRNKVRSNKIISVSGKANCVCCNKSLRRLKEDEKSGENRDYNERFKQPSYVICEDCINNLPECEACGNVTPNIKYYPVENKETGEIRMICESCYKNEYKKCPICGENFSINGAMPQARMDFVNIYSKYSCDDLSNKMTRCCTMDYPIWHKQTEKTLLPSVDRKNNILVQICCCVDCLEKLSIKENEDKIWKYLPIIPYNWHFGEEAIKRYINTATLEYKKVLIDEDLIKKTLSSNVGPAEADKDGIIRVRSFTSDAKEKFYNFAKCKEKFI